VRFAAVVLVAIVLVLSRPKAMMVVGEAVRGMGAVTERKSGGRSQDTKYVGQGEQARHAGSDPFGQPNEHQPLLRCAVRWRCAFQQHIIVSPSKMAKRCPENGSYLNGRLDD
jgi:hypothetical protein